MLLRALTSQGAESRENVRLAVALTNRAVTESIAGVETFHGRAQC